MNKNGCNNRPPLRDFAWVQIGWTHKGFKSREPVIDKIDDPMTKTCQYQKLKKDDPGCIGCKELEK